MMTKLLTIILLAALLASCTAAKPDIPAIPTEADLQAWVDAPLEGTMLTLPVSYTLVCHGSDPAGVQAIEFSLEGQVLGTVLNEEPGATLFHASQLWTPLEPGRYTIQCRAQAPSGEWGGYVGAHVFVVERAEATSSTPSETPTETAIPTDTPSPTQAAITFSSRVSTSLFEYQHDCVPSPGEVTITAVLSSTAGVKSVYLFYRLESSTLGVITDWNPGVVMSKSSDGYSSTIAWNAIPQLNQIQWSSAVFAYQFIAVDAGETAIARSQVFRDITLAPCD